MSDYLHAGLKWVSYNRWTVLGILMVALALSLASCQATATWNGEDMTADQIEAVVAEEAAALEQTHAEIVHGAERKVEIAEQMIAEATAEAELAGTTLARRMELLAEKKALAEATIQRTYDEWEAWATFGSGVIIDNGLVPPAVASAITGALALLLGRKDKSRADSKVTSLKAENDRLRVAASGS